MFLYAGGMAPMTIFSFRQSMTEEELRVDRKRIVVRAKIVWGVQICEWWLLILDRSKNATEIRVVGGEVCTSG